jgi:hypothetical protein
MVALVWGCSAGPALSPVWEGDGLPNSTRIFAEVSRIRELPAGGNPRVRFLRRSELSQVLASEGKEPDTLARHAKRIGLASSDVALSTERARLLSASGLYRSSDKTIYVVDDPNRRFPALLEQVVAHESVHALQDQHGLLPKDDEQFSPDEELARRALLEGDATLGELLYDQREWHTPTKRLAERVRRGFAEEPIASYVASTTPELVDSPAYQRESLVFPYYAGSAFVATLLATGGYALLARAYAAPPRSTSHVLHPERYARGESPVPVPEPTPPSNFVLGDRLTLGELLTRQLLMRCNTDERAIEAADGWRGDSTVTLRSAGGEAVAQQWLTDSDRDAQELASALQTTCDDASSRDLLILARGQRVVAIHGMAMELARELASKWLNVPLTPDAPTPPLAGIELVPPTRGIRSDPYLSGGWLHLPTAGIELPVPAGFVLASRSRNNVALRGPDGASIELRFLLGEYFPGAAGQLVRFLSRSMELEFAYSNVVEVGEPSPLSLPHGPATVQAFGHGGTGAKGRTVAVSLCGGAGLLAVIQYEGRPPRKVPEILSGLRDIEGSRVCADLEH